jgi:hypothetical protein
MGADPIFFEHAPEEKSEPPRVRRKRIPRVIEDIDPDTSRRLAPCIERFRPGFHRDLRGIAEAMGIPTDWVLIYSLVSYYVAMPPVERLGILRGIFPDVDDAEIERACADLKRRLHVEMGFNRKRKRSQSMA